MHPVRRIIDGLIQFSQEYAEMEQTRCRLMENSFVFGIAIGRGRRLTPEERTAYTKTRITAEVLALIEDPAVCSRVDSEGTSDAITEALANWLEEEPELRGALEAEFKCKLSDFSESPKMAPTMRSILVKQLRALSAACPEALGEDEIKSVVERLEHPLDRA